MKKCICIMMMFILSLSCAAHAAETFCITVESLTALVDEAGKNHLVGDTYTDIICVQEDALYAAGEKGKYQLFSAEGVQLSDTVFSMVDYSEGVLIFRQAGLYGAMYTDGSPCIAPEWTQLVANGQGGFLALDSYPMDDVLDEIIHIDAIDADNEPVRTGSYTANGLSEIENGRMPFMASDGRYGYADATGKVVMTSSWLYAGGFSNGLARVADENGQGIIDVDGNIVIETAYDYLERGDALIAGLTSDGTLDVYAPDGKSKQFSIAGEGIQITVVDGCVAAMDAGKTCLYDANGALLLTASAGAVISPGLNGQMIVADGEWGEACQWLINADGSAASGKYQRIIPLCGDRYASLAMSGVSYYSNDLGSIQKSWDYESVRYGLLDGAGEAILPTEYLEIRGLGENRLLLVTAEGTHFADMDGKVLRTWITAETIPASSELDA